MYRPFRYFVSSVFVFLSLIPSTSYAWYGKTHKWLAQEAASFLPEEEKDFFERYRDALFRGAIGADRFAVEHHTYFELRNGRRVVVDDSAPLFAETKAYEAIEVIERARQRGQVTQEDLKLFVEKCGEAIHPVCDMHAAHTERSEDQDVHREIELEVNMDVQESERLNSSQYPLKFDGKLRGVDPYKGTVEVARLAHYGSRTVLPAADFLRRIPMGEDGTGAFIGAEEWDSEIDRTLVTLLNKQANVSAEVLHWIYVRAFVEPIEITQDPRPTDVSQNPTNILQNQAITPAEVLQDTSAILKSDQEPKEQGND